MLSWETTTPRRSIISSTSRKLNGKRWYSHTQWLMISAGKRTPRYDGVSAPTSQPPPQPRTTRRSSQPRDQLTKLTVPSQAWFYKWRRGDVSLRRKRRAALAALIAYLFARHRGSYGSPRIIVELRERGWRGSENTVAEMMGG